METDRRVYKWYEYSWTGGGLLFFRCGSGYPPYRNPKSSQSVHRVESYNDENNGLGDLVVTGGCSIFNQRQANGDGWFGCDCRKIGTLFCDSRVRNYLSWFRNFADHFFCDDPKKSVPFHWKYGPSDRNRVRHFVEFGHPTRDNSVSGGEEWDWSTGCTICVADWSHHQYGRDSSIRGGCSDFHRTNSWNWFEFWKYSSHQVHSPIFTWKCKFF